MCLQINALIGHFLEVTKLKCKYNPDTPFKQ